MAGDSVLQIGAGGDEGTAFFRDTSGNLLTVTERKPEVV
jgi:hypothetical protein